jgi:hypothetical protein
MSNSDFLKDKQPDRKPLNEPAPKDIPDSPPGNDPRMHVNDGLDNSDLRMLLDLATKQAKEKE